MIYLRKGQAQASTNDEDFAKALEQDGYVRITGRERLGKVLLNATRNAVTQLLIPGIPAGVVYAAMGGTDIEVFITSILIFYLFSQ